MRGVKRNSETEAAAMPSLEELEKYVIHFQLKWFDQYAAESESGKRGSAL